MALLSSATSILLLHVITSIAENSERDSQKKPNGWEFLQEGVTLVLIARNYDLYGRNRTDCLTGKTVSKDNTSHTITQELHFRNPNTSKWSTANETLNAYSEDGKVYNFMNTSTAGRAQYNFLFTNNGCAIVEVMYSKNNTGDHLTTTPTTPVASLQGDGAGSPNALSTDAAEGSKKARRCAMWVRKDALNRTHDFCLRSFLCDCDSKSVYPVYNRTECENNRAIQERN
uniref:Lipocalin n=1 Tax=Rhipicephalus appendiculatus TaxID=34631 RepID=A0A131YMW0_RHIAP